MPLSPCVVAPFLVTALRTFTVLPAPIPHPPHTRSYYNTDGASNYEETMKAVVAEYQQLGLPMKYIMCACSWWAGGGGACCRGRPRSPHPPLVAPPALGPTRPHSTPLFPPLRPPPPRHHPADDSWWYFKNDQALGSLGLPQAAVDSAARVGRGVEEVGNPYVGPKGALLLWEPMPSVFPDQMSNWLNGMPLALHNRYFARENK